MLQPKDIKWLKGYKIKTCIYAAYKRLSSKDTHRLKVRGWGNIPCKWNQKKTKVATLISDKESESESCSVVSDSLQLHGLCPWNSPGQNTGVGSLSLLQGIFPTQGSNTGLQHCRWILYQLSHKGSPRILEWVTYPCPSGPSNWGLLYCRQILYQLSYKGGPISDKINFKTKTVTRHKKDIT